MEGQKVAMHDIDKDTLRFIIYETTRFGIGSRTLQTKYTNRFAVELEWKNAEGATKKHIFVNFNAYRAWWMQQISLLDYAITLRFWEEMNRKYGRDD